MSVAPIIQDSKLVGAVTYAHLTEEEKQALLNKAYNVRSEKEMYSLVASLANGISK